MAPSRVPSKSTGLTASLSSCNCLKNVTRSLKVLRIGTICGSSFSICFTVFAVSNGFTMNTSTTPTLLFRDGIQAINFRLAHFLLHFGQLLVKKGLKLGDDRLNAVRWFT
jgi:hypothetical protein